MQEFCLAIIKKMAKSIKECPQDLSFVLNAITSACQVQSGTYRNSIRVFMRSKKVFSFFFFLRTILIFFSKL